MSVFYTLKPTATPKAKDFIAQFQFLPRNPLSLNWKQLGRVEIPLVNADRAIFHWKGTFIRSSEVEFTQP